MNKTFALLTALAAGMPAAVSARTVQGVDWDAVPWSTFCPNVAPVELRTTAGRCATTHPASVQHARWTGFGMGVQEPPPDCARLEQEFRQWTRPKRIAGNASDNPAVTWGYCMSAFARAIELRTSQLQRFTESFEQWRARYFGGYIAGAGR